MDSIELLVLSLSLCLAFNLHLNTLFFSLLGIFNLIFLIAKSNYIIGSGLLLYYWPVIALLTHHILNKANV